MTLLDERETATVLNVSPKKLQRDRWLCIGLPYVKLQRAVRYDLRDIEQYIDLHKVKPKG